MDHPTCKTCPYWSYMDGPDPGNRPANDPWFDDLHGECRRLPPQMHGSMETADLDSSWPLIQGEEWCGEHPRFDAYLAHLRTPTASSISPAPSSTADPGSGIA